MRTIISMPVTAKETVLAFIEAMNKTDYREARNYTSDEMKFVGVLGTRDGAEAYFKDMEKMRLRYKIRRVWVDKEDVCLFYEINMSGNFVPAFGWYTLENGKIVSIRVIFDPQPILDQSEKQYENG